MQFETIIGFTRAEAYGIVSNDTWFAKNANDESVQRYIKYETDATGKHVISISRSNTPKDGHFQADKTLDVKNIVTDTDAKIAAYLFSVNANKGPSNEVKKFFANGGVVTDDTEKKFLGHVAWLVGNQGYGSDTDLLCQYERFYTEKELPMLDLATGRDIFSCDMYQDFVEILLTIETDEFCPNERARLTAGLEQDLSLVNRFL
jgi:hypothetical protein